MLYRKTNVWTTLDWWTVFLYIILVVSGWVSIYASTYDFDQVNNILDLSKKSGMQMIWILSSMMIGFLILMIESDWYEIFSTWIYLLMMFLLIVTIFVAPAIKGSRSWLIVGSLRIQPAEFAKFATALVVAKVMSTYRLELRNVKNLLIVFSFIFLPIVLILLQKETGSSLVFFAFLFVLYREGMPGVVLFSGFTAILLFVLAVRYAAILWNATPIGELLCLIIVILFVLGLLYYYRDRDRDRWVKIKKLIYTLFIVCLLLGISSFFIAFNLCWIALFFIVFLNGFLFISFLRCKRSAYLWIMTYAICSVVFSYSIDYLFNNILKSHQKIRIEVTLGTAYDPEGAGYNVNQSKIAIGSGGFMGKGYLKGTQTKLNYVPEQDTDFIFCTVGEEKGFIGSVLILSLFLILILRVIFLAERQRSIFSRIYGYSVSSIIFFHLVINIGMVIGLTPVIGIPLPFFSYGGSSLWAFTILLFIFLRLDASRIDRL